MTADRKPTSKRSALDEGPIASLADSIEVTAISGEASDEEFAIAQERERLIEAYVREHLVPRHIAVIMADKGYSKGSAYRIYNDAQKKKMLAREREAGLVA